MIVCLENTSCKHKKKIVVSSVILKAVNVNTQQNNRIELMNVKDFVKDFF